MVEAPSCELASASSSATRETHWPKKEEAMQFPAVARPPPPVLRGRDTDGANDTGSVGDKLCGKAGAGAGMENDVAVVSGK